MSSRSEVFEFHASGGGLAADDPSYVPRPEADGTFLEALLRGDYCYVLNARQMGKSSLRNRTIAKLIPDADCIVIDLQYGFDRTMTADQFCQSLMKQVVQQTQLQGRISPAQWWAEHSTLSPFQRFDELLELLLQSSGRRAAFFVDEIDKLLDFEFRDDFLLRIRSYYERRQVDPAYHRVVFVLIGVAAPSELVCDQRKSPFNIGVGIPLAPLRLEEARRTLRPGLASFRDPDALLGAVFGWTGGQPFLTQRVCELAAEQPQSPELSEYNPWLDELVRRSIIQNRMFLAESHIRNIHARILPSAAGDLAGETRSANLLGLYSRIVEGKCVESDGSPEQIELRLTGLVIERDGRLEIANRIYESIFDRAWVTQRLAGLRPYSASFSQWLREKRSEDYLLRGAALEAARQWSRGKSLTEDDREYLRESETSEAVKSERLAAGARYRRLAWILAIVSLLAIGFAIFAWVQRGIAQKSQANERKQAELARKAEAAAHTNAEEARLAAAAARTNAEEAGRQKELADANAQKAETEAGREREEARRAELLAERLERAGAEALQNLAAGQDRRKAEGQTSQTRDDVSDVSNEASRSVRTRTEAEHDPQLALNVALYAWRRESPRISNRTVEAVYYAVLGSLIAGKAEGDYQSAGLAFQNGEELAGAEFDSGLVDVKVGFLFPPVPREHSISPSAVLYTPSLPLYRRGDFPWCGGARVSAVSVSARGTAATGCSDGSVILRTGADMRQLAASFRPHSRGIQALGVDDRNSISVDADGNVAFAVAGQVKWRRRMNAPVSKALLSVGGQWAAAGTKDNWTIWEAKTGQEVPVVVRGPDIAFDPAGSCLLSRDSVLNLQQYKQSPDRGYLTGVPPGLGLGARRFATPDCRHIVSGDVSGNVTFLGDSPSDSGISLSQRPASIDAMVFSSDGSKLATAAGTEVIVWDFKGATAVAPLLQAFGQLVQSEVQNGELAPARQTEFDALLPLARKRVTRQLTQQECEKYFGPSGCPKEPI